MSYTISPNMNLIVPTVGQEPGPNFALDVNASLGLIDQHDHSPGKGVQITPAGMNINTNLNFQGNAAINLNYAEFQAQASVPTPTLQAISVAPSSSINELWYTDSNGNATQITKNGAVNAVASSIEGESYIAGTFIWTQAQSFLPNTPANFDIGSITIRPNVDGTMNGVILGPPASIASLYNINLPLRPVGNPAFLTIDTSGNISSSPSTANGITAANIANGTITTTQISSSAGILGSQLSASAGIVGGQLASSTVGINNMALSTQNSNSATYSNGTNSFTTIVSVSYVSHALTERPIFFNFSGPIEYSILNAQTIHFQLINITDNVVLATWTFTNNSSATQFYYVSLAEFNQMFLSTVFNATKTYALQGSGPGITTNGQTVNMNVFQV